MFNTTILIGDEDLEWHLFPLSMIIYSVVYYSEKYGNKIQDKFNLCAICTNIICII